jgi:nucleotide-binding universal stress UspA family protein
MLNMQPTIHREVSMFKHLLVSTDGSKLSGKAVAHAFGLAGALHARVTVFYASPDYPSASYSEAALYVPVKRKEYAAACKQTAGRVLDPIVTKGRGAGLQIDTMHTIAAAPWEAILAAARKQKCDAIVMASHGRRGISALLLGSETQKVLTHSKLPVIVVR